MSGNYLKNKRMRVNGVSAFIQLLALGGAVNHINSRVKCLCLRTDNDARSTLDPMYDEGCPHRVADKSNCDLRPE